MCVRQIVDKELSGPKLLGIAEKLADACDENIDVPRRRRSLMGTFSSHLLGGEVSCYAGARLPRVKMGMYFARQSFLQAVRCLQGQTSTISPVFAELKQLCERPAVSDVGESLLQGWMTTQQEVGKAGPMLAAAKLHLARAATDGAVGPDLCCLSASVDEVSQQLLFLLHRAVTIRKLIAAANKQRDVMMAEDFQMQEAYEVVDAWREAVNVADSFAASGVNLEGFDDVARNPDIEMMCVSMHFLANMLASIGFNDKAKSLHVRVLATASSLEPS